MKFPLVLPLILTATVLLGQTSEPVTTTVTAVPRMVRINSSFRPVNGAPAASVESATLSIYGAETGGTALWQEVQNIGLDSDGRYSVLLGSTRNEGLPVDLFTAGEPRWLGVQFQRPGEVEQPRVLMASVPYALKAADAETLGGQPASAFLLAPRIEQPSSQSGPATAATTIAPGRLTPKFTSGTTNHIAKFVSSLDLGDSLMVESNGNIGIGTSTPAAALEIVTTGGGAQFTNTLANNFTFNTFSSPGNASYLYNFGNAYPTSGRFVQSSTLLDAGNILSLSAVSNIRFYTNGSNERMRIDGNGNAGIGTLTPATRLDVAGDISLSGSLFKGGVRLLYSLGDNTALGFNTLLNNTGGGNTAVGISALASNTTGFHNTASGEQALLNNTTGSENTANGVNALALNTTGYWNTVNGFDAMFYNTTGNSNTASGYQALFANTTGSLNTASGIQSLYNNTTGAGNTATGTYALQENTTGNENTAGGWGALNANNTGSQNSAYGVGALNQNTTGGQNTAFGYEALETNKTGIGNIAIGDFAGQNLANNYNISIGNRGDTDDDATIRLGDIQTKTFIAGIRGAKTGVNNAIPVVIDTNGQLGTVSSSRRYKEDIHDMADASSNLFKLRPVTFRYKKPYSGGSKPIEYGLIAEEVAEVYPDLVVLNKDGQIETVQYQKLTPMLLNEVQKEHATNQQQQEQIVTLQEQNRQLEARLAALEAMLSSKPTATSSQQPE